jgi:23S rRNA pseudouridine2604 synthase
MTDAIRLAKRVAALVPCSRREAELYIAGGWVRVNGVVVEEPQHRVADEVVEIDRNATLAALAPVTFLLHKPAGAGATQAEALLVPGARAGDDRSGIRIGRSHVAHLVPLLPLPAAASGLAVFSQEPRIVRRLTEDAMTLEQELVVEVSGAIADDGLARLCHGLSFEGRALPPIKASWQNETRLRFAMKGIAPDLVPWMCEQVGLRVVALKRIRLGRLPMAGLPVGQWRILRPDERF